MSRTIAASGNLLEREETIDALQSALNDARSGEGRVVFVGGEAGIGKTSVVETFVRSCGEGIRTAWGHCESLSAPRPLGPFHDIALQVGSELEAGLAATATAAEVLPLLLRTFRRPIILVIEDAHWADEATLDLIKLLGRRLHAVPVLLIVTYRDDEIDSRHGLHAVLGALATSRIVSHIALAPLSLDAVRLLVAERPVAAEGIYRLTGGNPFFVVEALAQPDAVSVPRAVSDIVCERVSRLPVHARDLLQAAAVLGSRPDARLLHTLSPRAPEAVEQCISLGLLRRQPTDLLFRHELVRRAVLETMAPLRIPGLHAEILDALIGSGEKNAAILAHHADGAGDADAVCRFAPVAAREAVAAGAHREAAAQWERVLRHMRNDAPRERAEALEGLAAACAPIDRQEEAIAARREAIGLWHTIGDTAREGASCAALAEPLVRSGRNAEAEESIGRAISILERGGASRDLAAALRIRAHLRMLDRDKEQAIHWGRKAIRTAQQVGDVESLAGANIAVGAALLVSDDPQGRNYLTRALELARAEGLHRLVGLAYGNLGSAYGEQFHLSEAERFLTEGLQHGAERDLDYTQHYMQAWLALVFLYQGRWSEAMEMASTVVEDQNVAAISRLMGLVAMARVKSRRGASGAKTLVDEALALAEPTGTLQRLAPVRTARAEAAWIAGDVDGARTEAHAAWELALQHRHAWHVGELAYWRSLIGETVELPDWAATPFALQVHGRWREAAQAWAKRGCPYERARALAESDREARLEALGLFYSFCARPAAEQLRRRMRQVGDGHIPRGPRPLTRNNSLGLTARQAEILPLLGDGLTNREIAEKLKISAKTVDHHVSAILAKLGVSSRSEAAGIATRW